MFLQHCFNVSPLIWIPPSFSFVRSTTYSNYIKSHVPFFAVISGIRVSFCNIFFNQMKFLLLPEFLNNLWRFLRRFSKYFYLFSWPATSMRVAGCSERLSWVRREEAVSPQMWGKWTWCRLECCSCQASLVFGIIFSCVYYVLPVSCKPLECWLVLRHFFRGGKWLCSHEFFSPQVFNIRPAVVWSLLIFSLVYMWAVWLFLN